MDNNLRIKQFFYQPADVRSDGTFDITDTSKWLIECECDNKNYTQSTMYKWLVDNCTGRWDTDSFMFSLRNGEFLYIELYDKSDALLFSLCHNVPLPNEYEYDGPM